MRSHSLPFQYPVTGASPEGRTTSRAPHVVVTAMILSIREQHLLPSLSMPIRRARVTPGTLEWERIQSTKKTKGSIG